MSSEEYRQRAISIVQEAIIADNAKDYDNAFKLYMKSFEWFELTLRYEKNPRTFEKVKQKLEEYIVRAEEIKKTTMTESPSSSSSYTAIKCPNVNWDDIAGLNEAKAILRQTVVMPIKFPSAFQDIKPWTGILLYGPPGTGKSMLAKAVATESNYCFISVSASDLVSKYLGDGERQVKKLFESAREQKPAIIFVDEIESMCSQRDESTHEASTRLLTEFLIQLDGVGNDSSGVLLLAATNLPWLLDAAMIRRLQQKIYIALPDANARLALFSKCAGVKRPKRLAQRTEGYSGSDISIVINRAKMTPLRIVESSTHFKRIDDHYTPCSPGDADAVEMTWNSVPDDKLVLTPVSEEDYYKSIEDTKPSVNRESLQRYIDWTREYGMEGQ
jgi:vacuolar protein-sorting-associated protein 4